MHGTDVLRMINAAQMAPISSSLGLNEHSVYHLNLRVRLIGSSDVVFAEDSFPRDGERCS